MNSWCFRRIPAGGHGAERIEVGQLADPGHRAAQGGTGMIAADADRASGAYRRREVNDALSAMCKVEHGGSTEAGLFQRHP
jgi:hypothetical protein